MRGEKVYLYTSDYIGNGLYEEYGTVIFDDCHNETAIFYPEGETNIDYWIEVPSKEGESKGGKVWHKVKVGKAIAAMEIANEVCEAIRDTKYQLEFFTEKEANLRRLEKGERR